MEEKALLFYRKLNFLAKITVRQWTLFGIFNLLVVAGSGLLMRLKFLYAMPFIHLKYLMHAHSHFAFVGWVSHMLMLLMLAVIFRKTKDDILPVRYQILLAVNILCAYGMFFTFAYQGYGAYSITFSTAGILVSYVFARMVWQDMKIQQLEKTVLRWFGAALLFLVVSSLGTFYLAYLMATQNIVIKLQLSAVYFYLHFQYNGWFFFAIMGLIQYLLEKAKTVVKGQNSIFWILFSITAPLYLLSVLWWDMGKLLYGLTIVAAITQLVVWVIWLKGFSRTQVLPTDTAGRKWLNAVLWLVLIALLFKFSLQALSVIPSVADYVYGFRPVIIGYLHLVLLLIVSVFIIGYVYLQSVLFLDRWSVLFVVFFVVGVVLNEVILGTQALMAFMGSGFVGAPWYLAIASCIIIIGLIGMLFRQYIGKFGL